MGKARSTREAHFPASSIRIFIQGKSHTSKATNIISGLRQMFNRKIETSFLQTNMTHGALLQKKTLVVMKVMCVFFSSRETMMKGGHMSRLIRSNGLCSSRKMRKKKIHNFRVSFSRFGTGT